ncbi:NAC domain-containing protein 16 isoform X1 [Typha latifolia]|uniref:NAC domain-containing protein 16 isoform X1 n=1 Tax=Typha latifolia TaxID=4733 RepID=UPI003C2C4911
MAKTYLPPGFRFHPTDVELILYYLKRMVMGKPFRVDVISVIELYKFAPWDLQDKSCLRNKDLEWYFFCPRDKKYANGLRTNRATKIGYWKTTGKDRPIVYNSRTVGMKKTLIFHLGKAPRGDRTDWVMHEFRLEDNELVAAGIQQDAYVLCKIFQKSGPGPKIGEQYGAPFSEEDWEDDITTEQVDPLPVMCSRSSGLLDNSTQLEHVCQQSVACGGGGEMSSTSAFPSADGGILLEELMSSLNDSPHYPGNMNGELPDLMPVHENNNVVFGVDTLGLNNELDVLTDQVGRNIMDNLYNSGNIESKYDFQPMLLELGREQYVELNDLDLLGEKERCELPIPDNLFAQHSLQHNKMDCPNFGINDVLNTASIDKDTLSIRPNILDDQSTFFVEEQGFGRSVGHLANPSFWADDIHTYSCEN